MSQDNQTSIPEAPKASRRAVLMGFAAAAIPMAPALANALGASAPDPVFAAIKLERAAYAAYLVPRAIQNQVSDQDPFPSPKPL